MAPHGREAVRAMVQSFSSKLTERPSLPYTRLVQAALMGLVSLRIATGCSHKGAWSARAIRSSGSLLGVAVWVMEPCLPLIRMARTLNCYTFSMALGEAIRVT